MIVKTVEPLRFRGNEAILFQYVDPQEIALYFRQPVRPPAYTDDVLSSKDCSSTPTTSTATGSTLIEKRCAIRPNAPGTGTSTSS